MAEHSEQLERGRFEGEVLARLDSLGQKMDNFSASQLDHENRLRVIEDHVSSEKGRTRNIAAGISGAISLLGVLASWYASK